MKNFVFILCCSALLPYQAHAQSIDLAAGINGDNDNSAVFEQKIEVKQDDKKVADDRGIFSFLNFSFIKKPATLESKPAVETEKNGENAQETPETPLQKIHRLAEEGNLESQLALGYMYLYGENGVTGDYAKAFKYYEMAAAQNDKIALNNLGSLYFNGIGTEVNYVKAAELFAQAAKLGSDDAAVNLAFIYLSGNNRSENQQEAVELFRQAANAGNNTARFMLGYAYYKGFQVQQDYYKAVDLMKISSEAQFDEAQYVLALMYINGQGIAKNYGNAVKYLSAAATQGNVPALMKLADILTEGTMYPRNLVRAHIMYNIASVLGAPDAAQKRDDLEQKLKLEELLPAQTTAEKFKPKPSELTSYIRQTFGNNIRRYIDENMK